MSWRSRDGSVASCRVPRWIAGAVTAAAVIAGCGSPVAPSRPGPASPGTGRQSPSGSPAPSGSRAPASAAQVQAFVARAERGSAGTFMVTYDVLCSGTGPVRHVQVFAAQRAPALFFYRRTPSLAQGTCRQTGARDEVLHGPGTKGTVYGCGQKYPSSPWMCSGLRTTEMGMSGAHELIDPYIPQALISGLHSAAAFFAGSTGLTPPPGTRAYIAPRQIGGQVLSCLDFGTGESPLESPLARACLDQRDVIAFYDIPGNVSSFPYQMATLVSSSRVVPDSVFKLPAPPRSRG